MARMIGGSPSDRWEREVKRELKLQLPDRWVVVSDVSYSIREDSGYIRDGQADFVILVPDKGLVVLEVKGSKGVAVTSQGDWLLLNESGAKKKIKSPPKQATRNSHNIATKLAELLGFDSFPGLFGWIVAYPNGIVAGPLDMYHPNSVLSKPHMTSLKKAVLATLAERGPEKLGRQFGKDLVDKCANYLVNGNFIVDAIDTALDSSETSHQVEKLTDQQFACLKGIFDLKDVGVIGPAGSGKTLLAMWRLQAALDEGMNAIYVCFNRVLAEYLRLKFCDLTASIHSIDKFFTDLTSLRNDGSSDFFARRLPEEVMDRSFTLEQYDLIIVDEGQDFLGDRVLALRFLLKDDEDSRFLMFSDFNQRLYHDADEMQNWPDVTFKLLHNCRNPASINRATNAICDTDFQSMPEIADGVPPAISMVDKEKMALEAWTLAYELRPRGGSVILSPYSFENSCMSRGPDVWHKLRLTEDPNHIGMEGYVYFSTIKSFKGLEAEHVILIEMDVPNKTRALGNEDIFVAFTRATSRLNLLTSSKEALDFYSERSSRAIGYF